MTRKNYSGIILLALGLCLLVFREHLATFLLGGPQKVQESFWMEDPRAYERVAGIVWWFGWTFLIAGATNIAVVAIMSRLRRSNNKPLH